jgi:hypothetical protein
MAKPAAPSPGLLEHRLRANGQGERFKVKMMGWPRPPKTGMHRQHKNPLQGDHPVKTITTIGIDLAKNSFSVYGVDAKGKPVLQP